MQFTRIKDLNIRLAEVGKIKIGGKGEKRTAKSSGREYQLPVKHGWFTVTTLERDDSGNFKADPAVMQHYGEHPTELDIILLHDEPAKNMPNFYGLYAGRKLWCQGDGEQAQRRNKETDKFEERACPCEYLEKENGGTKKFQCKPHAILSVMLPQSAQVGGVYKFRTTSWNSLNNILAAMEEITAITNGILAGIPLKLKVQGKTIAVADTVTTIYIVSLGYPGDVFSLLERAKEIGQRRAVGYRETLALRGQIDKLLEADPEAETEADIQEEFYPEGNGDIIDGEVVTDAEAATPSVDFPKSEPEEPPPPEEPPDIGDECPFANGEPGPYKPPETKPMSNEQRNGIFATARRLRPNITTDDALKKFIRIFALHLGDEFKNIGFGKNDPNLLTMPKARKLWDRLQEEEHKQSGAGDTGSAPAPTEQAAGEGDGADWQDNSNSGNPVPPSPDSESETQRIHAEIERLLNDKATRNKVYFFITGLLPKFGLSKDDWEKNKTWKQLSDSVLQAQVLDKLAAQATQREMF